MYREWEGTIPREEKKKRKGVNHDTLPPDAHAHWQHTHCPLWVQPEIPTGYPCRTLCQLLMLKTKTAGSAVAVERIFSGG
jgi:hypothetical protein